jgi:hypothetical protein
LLSSYKVLVKPGLGTGEGSKAVIGASYEDKVGEGVTGSGWKWGMKGD